MDGELWTTLYRALRAVARTHTTQPGMSFSDRRIVEVHLWAVLHDRPVSWAVQPRHWLPHRRSQPLPGDVTMSRRLERLGVLQLLEALEDLLCVGLPMLMPMHIDAMPLPVGGHSKDPDAAWGRAANGQAKG